MAPVGQTWPQRVQRYSQQPIRGTSNGVQRPSRPASSRAGCSPPVRQTFMHSPHFTQRRRKSGSGKAPGGRISVGSAAPAAASGVTRRSGTAAAPAASDAMTRRLPRSIPLPLPAEKPNRTAPVGQRSAHFMQAMHSLAFQPSFVPGPAPTGQATVQTPQPSHPSLTDRFRTARRERRPNSAPRGQR